MKAVKILNIGSRVHFTESRAKTEPLCGIIISQKKMHLTIEADNGKTYLVHQSRIKNPPKLTIQNVPLSAGRIRKFPKTPSTPKLDAILEKNEINKTLTNCAFTAHATERFHERMSGYTPQELEGFLAESEEAPWIKYDKTCAKAFYHAPTKIAFITDNSGLKIITFYYEFNTPPKSAKLQDQKKKIHQRNQISQLEEDLDEAQFSDARIYNQVSKSLKKDKHKKTKHWK